MRNYLLLIFLLVSGHLIASPVDIGTALKQAQTFAKSHGIQLNVAETSFKAPRKSDKAAASSSSYYVFNNTGGGFVIVSGDDRTSQILGYSDTGKLNEGNLPVNVSSWLQSYADQIAYLDDNNVTVDSTSTVNSTSQAKSAPMRSQQTTHAVAPLVTSEWNQRAPFNNVCPYFYYSDGTAERSVTGCVATAMAQVMYYHKWPATTKEDIAAWSKNWNQSDGTTKTATLDAVASGTAINWNDMTDTYSSSSTDAQNTAVANLMRYCGQSVNMDYGQSSGAYTPDAATQLKTTFNYDEDLAYISRSDYTIAKWNNIIYNEVSNSRPVLYSGQSTGGGHAFVVDGYDGEGYYHLNWGWGGSCDGYFALAVLNPESTSGAGASSTPDGYSMAQGAIIGIMPPDGKTTEPEPLKLTTTSLTLSSNTINANYYNWSGETASFNYGIGYIDGNGNIIPIGTPASAYNLSINSGYNTTFYVTDLAAGTYKIVTISKESYKTGWQNSMNIQGEYVNAVVDASGNVTLKLHEVTPILTATFELTGTKSAGIAQPVAITVKNTGDEYNGIVYFFMSTDASDKGTYASYTGAAIPADGSFKLSFSFTPNAAGTYYLWLARNSSGTNVIGTDTVVIGNAITSSTDISATGITIENSDNSNEYTIYGDKIKGYVTIKNNDTANPFVGSIDFIFYNNSSGSFSGYYYGATAITIPANGTGQVPFSYDGDIGTGYIIGVFNGTTSMAQYGYTNAPYYYVLTPGYITYAADGTEIAAAPTSSITVADGVAAVNLTGITTVTSITPNSNPNTLYIFGADATTPSGLTGKNIIKGSTAATINLTDGNSFYTPISFTATSIDYSRTPGEVSADGSNGWETIALPFEVKSITNKTDNKTIDFFHSSTGSGDFWVDKFSELDDNNKIMFDYAEKMEANTPYIVAFPGDHWGAQYSLKDKNIVFHGESAEIAADSKIITGSIVYDMKGTTATLNNVSNAYLLNDNGNKFVLNNTATVKPFRAYFTPRTLFASLPSSLGIVIGNGTTTAVMLPIAEEGENVNVYTLSGIKAATVKVTGGVINTNGLKKGIYVIKGKKFIVK